MNRSISMACMAGLVAPIFLAAQEPDSTHATPAPPTALAKLSGYVTSSFTYSTHPLGDTIVGRAFDRRHNEFMLNVGNLTFERLPANDRLSAGFHFEAWLGQNATPVKSTGLDLGPSADIWQSYVALNVPLSGEGRYLLLKGGKMATLMGVEVGEEILNPNVGIGYQDIFLEPYTETGVELDAKLSQVTEVDIRVSNGWDQVTDVNSGKTVMVRLGLTPDDKTLLAVVGYTGPEQADNTSNRRSGVNALLSRKVTSSATGQVQVDYGQEDGAASNGEQAKWYAAGLWAAIDLAAKTTLSVRADYMNDRDGARTSGVLGFPVNDGMTVRSLTATLNLKQFEHALVRPEIRYDHSSLAVFGGHSSQVSIGAALSYIF